MRRLIGVGVLALILTGCGGPASVPPSQVPTAAPPSNPAATLASPSLSPRAAIDHVLASLDRFESLSKSIALIAGGDVADTKALGDKVTALAIEETTWIKTSALDGFVERRYSDLLSALVEPSLLETEAQQRIYAQVIVPEVLRTIADVRERALAVR
jgi:hypothetical protein